MGKGEFAIVNPIWAACSDESNIFVPDTVHFITDENLEPDYVNRVFKWVDALLKGFGVEDPKLKSITINESDFDCIEETIKCEILDLKQKGSVAVDMTPGRKYLAAIIMHTGISMGVDHVYYLYLKDSEKYRESPFPLIPKTHRQLVDMMKKGICSYSLTKEKN